MDGIDHQKLVVSDIFLGNRIPIFSASDAVFGQGDLAVVLDALLTANHRSLALHLWVPTLCSG